ncbi:MAG: cytochrome d ubiquinol oxidase subunit II [Phycisphaerae bacterium]|nr:cytochrome d ubiquinol oxidase subunit II [Phycisphaerae bacterium]
MNLAYETLCEIWFVLLIVLLTGYAILDGFDLGVGILHLTTRDDRERRILLNSIGPLWDGNEVWLVTFGGALFAAFPDAYATVFSGFYIAFMLLLFALIFRAISIEFRSKTNSPIWRRTWDIAFSISSTVATLLFGVAVGNIMIGIPIGSNMEFHGHFFDLLRPYPLLVGLFAVSMFAMHGAIYLHLKTEGSLQEHVYQWMWRSFGCFLVLYMLTTIFTLVHEPRAVQHFESHPWLWAIVVLNVLAIANIPRTIFYNKPMQAFLSSCASIVGFIFLFAMALFPNIVTASNPEHSMSIYNSASSAKTLTIMLIIAALGMPFVIGYTAVIYWVFRGKVQLGEHSY